MISEIDYVKTRLTEAVKALLNVEASGLQPNLGHLLQKKPWVASHSDIDIGKPVSHETDN